MNTATLLEIVNTRMRCPDDNNPTSRSFLYELSTALTRLQELEKAQQLANSSPRESDNSD